MRTQGHHAVARPAHRPVVPPARSSQGGRKFKAEVEANVKRQLRTFEKRLSAQDAAKATAVAAQAAAMKSKYQALRSKYLAAEAMLRRKQQRLGPTVSSQIDNVYGDLGALSPHSMAMALHPVVPAVYAASGMQKQQQHPLATASRVQERSRSGPATTRSQELADASTIKAAQGSAEHRKLLMEAKALGFGNVHAFVEHQRRIAGGVNLSGQADAIVRALSAHHRVPHRAHVLFQTRLSGCRFCQSGCLTLWRRSACSFPKSLPFIESNRLFDAAWQASVEIKPLAWSHVGTLPMETSL